MTDDPQAATRACPQRYRRGVGIMLVNDAGKVFVARRTDTPDAWQMPQGGIDAGEVPHHAALRELGEETGTRRAEIVAETQNWLRYDLPQELLGRVWGGRYRGQEQKWFLLRFTGTDADIALDGPDGEFDAWRWAEPDEVRNGIVGFKRPLYEAVFREFAPHLDGLRGER